MEENMKIMKNNRMKKEEGRIRKRRKKEERWRRKKGGRKRRKKTRKLCKKEKPEENEKTGKSTKTVGGRTHRNPPRRRHLWVVKSHFLSSFRWVAVKPLKKCFQSNTRRTPPKHPIHQNSKNLRCGFPIYPGFFGEHDARP